MADSSGSLRRGVFLGTAAAVAAAAPAAAWPRPEDPKCDAPRNDDIDAPWHPQGKDVPDDANSGYLPGHALTLEETQKLGHKLAMMFVDDPDLRERYYHVIRTYKKTYFSSHGNGGGRYGGAYITLLKEKLKLTRVLQLDDIANLHLTAFLHLRRAALALTAHDIDPDSTGIGTRSVKNIFSFHFGPNDGSNYSFAPADLASPNAP